LEALERTKAELADSKLRAETAAEIELVVRNMIAVGAEFDTVAARLSEFTARAVPLLWEARGLNDFITVGRAQVPPAVDLVAQMLRAHADAVMAGKAPATLPRPEELPLKAAEIAPKVRHRPKMGPDMASDPVLVEANFQSLDRGPARVLKVTS
jgi:hypothetical protein